MKRFNVLIIDDERNIREALSSLMQQFCPEIHVCGVAGSAEEGRTMLEEYNIDIIFLDISMPKEDGFEFLSSIPREKYGIIFITAFQEYALRALKASAIDYILKPIDPKELKEAVKKAINLMQMRRRDTEVQEAYFESLKNLQSHLIASEKYVMKITVPEQYGYKVVSVPEILYLEAYSNYTKLYTVGNNVIVGTRNLGEFEKIIQNPEFYRIHKSILININYLTGFSTYEGNFAELKDGTRLSISKRKAIEFKDYLKKYYIPVE